MASLIGENIFFTTCCNNHSKVKLCYNGHCGARNWIKKNTVYRVHGSLGPEIMVVKNRWAFRQIAFIKNVWQRARNRLAA
jgi:hypothetical protein